MSCYCHDSFDYFAFETSVCVSNCSNGPMEVQTEKDRYLRITGTKENEEVAKQKVGKKGTKTSGGAEGPGRRKKGKGWEIR